MNLFGLYINLNFPALLNALPGGIAQGLIWGIMAIGLYITYKILNLSDLTVDGSMATGGAVCIMMISAGYNVWLSLLIAFLAGMVAGLVTGIFHTQMGIPAILAGILTQMSLYSINLLIMGYKANQSVNVNKVTLVTSSRYVRELSIRNPIFVSVVFLAVLVAILYLFFGTEIGSALRATGSNENMARAQGINTKITKIIGLMIANGMVSLSSALFSQYQGFADVNMGRGAIVIGLASIIIAEVLFGRIFRRFAATLCSVALGAVIYYIVITIVLWLGLNTNLLKMFSALVVAIFLAIPHWKNELSAGKGGK